MLSKMVFLPLVQFLLVQHLLQLYRIGNIVSGEEELYAASEGEDDDEDLFSRQLQICRCRQQYHSVIYITITLDAYHRYPISSASVSSSFLFLTLGYSSRRTTEIILGSNETAMWPLRQSLDSCFTHRLTLIAAHHRSLFGL